MGNVMRSYWHPVCTSAQLPEPDAPPLRVRLLGEDFVAYRDSAGRVGMLDELCMHRGASLALGRVEEGGLRCIYHGWKFSVDGAVMDTPNNPDERHRSRQAPATRCARKEAWLCPWARRLPPDHGRPARHRVAAHRRRNYLQLVEGGEDSSHVGVLHSKWRGPRQVVRAESRCRQSSGTFRGRQRPEMTSRTPTWFHYVCPQQAEGRSQRSRFRSLSYGRAIPAFQFTVLEVPADDTHTAPTSSRTASRL
jgi:phenylpropionate dioxygenase-like ring-hydroxylating dioxygenase large terminal subunit